MVFTIYVKKKIISFSPMVRIRHLFDTIIVNQLKDYYVSCKVLENSASHLKYMYC